MKTIHKTISIGTGDMELHVDASIDGKKILDKKSDSLVGQFAKMLYGCMQPQAMPFKEYFGSIAPTSITDNGGGLIKVVLPYNASFDSMTTGNTVTIGGALGCTEANGTWTVTGSYNNFTLDGSAFVHAYTGGAVVSLFKQDNRPFGTQAFGNAGILVGIGTTAVTISDFSLDTQILNGSSTGQLTYNAFTTSQDSNDTTSAQVTMTRTFTNNSGSSITVNEIALLMSYYYESYSTYKTITARDVVSGGITIAAGKTLTLNYRIKTILATTGDTGGFIASFMRILYAQIAQTTRAVFDITNNSHNIQTTDNNLLTVCGGGLGVLTRNIALSTLASENIGIQVGTGTNAVSMGDYGLQTKIAHGSTTSRLLYHGSFIDDYLENGTTDATFTINRIFENVSGGTITINEIGVYSGMSDGGEIPKWAACTIRNKLATPVALPDTEILKVIYTIKVIA